MPNHINLEMDSKISHIAVLGAGSWGTALAVVLGKKGYKVSLWARRTELAQDINVCRENTKYLPGVIIPKEVTVSDDLKGTVEGANLIVLSVPSQSVREIARTMKPYLAPNTIIVNTAKGIENGTLLRLSQVLQEELPKEFYNSITILSGPSHAEEVGQDLPTTVVVAANNLDVAEKVQDIFMTPYFRVYTSLDLPGVEIAGALKNVIALGTGIADGLGYGDNTKAALITRGLAEITRLGVAMEADSQTFAGLAGIGDLIVTCTSMHSRNRRAGIQIGQGRSLEDVLKSSGMVVEGVTTTKAAHFLAQKFNVEMPIMEQAYSVLFEGIDPREAVICLMSRSKAHEGEKDFLALRY